MTIDKLPGNADIRVEWACLTDGYDRPVCIGEARGVHYPAEVMNIPTVQVKRRTACGHHFMAGKRDAAAVRQQLVDRARNQVDRTGQIQDRAAHPGQAVSV